MTTENLWERFDDIADANEVEQAKAQSVPMEIGEYEMILEEIKPTMNDAGIPRLVGRLKTTEGRTVYYNQNLQIAAYPNMTPMLIGQAVAFIEGLIDDEYTFSGLAKLATDVEAIETGSKYAVGVTYDEKRDSAHKFPKLEILELLEKF